MVSPKIGAALLALAVASACAHAQKIKDTSSSPLQHLNKSERAALIARAQIWSATDVPSMNLRVGPQGKGSFEPDATVECKYVQIKMSGDSAKFTCELAPGDQVKIKYGAANVEVYAEVAASRLFWALGFGADRWYPVKVVCHGCSADPMKIPAPIAGDTTFDVAAIERKFPGKTIETFPDEGWKWNELKLIDETQGGASLAQVDALKLLAVMVQHTDSKEQQQRLVCLPHDGDKDAVDGTCSAPFMFVHDIGLTFGKSNIFNKNVASGANFANWSSKAVWSDRGGCRANMDESWSGTLDSPVISEAGRKFLSDLLAQLTDDQLRDMFVVARFPEYSHKTADDWITVFKQKREEIASAHCK